MQNEKEIPLHKYYLLLDNHTMKPLWITLNKKTYMFLVNRQYFLNPKKEFFSIKEKLYILNLSCNVVWNPISTFNHFYKAILFNTISPCNLQLNIVRGKVTPYISKKGVFLNAQIIRRTF